VELRWAVEVMALRRGSRGVVTWRGPMLVGSDVERCCDVRFECGAAGAVLERNLRPAGRR
jgi:hypothetical protein